MDMRTAHYLLKIKIYEIMQKYRLVCVCPKQVKARMLLLLRYL